MFAKFPLANINRRVPRPPILDCHICRKLSKPKTKTYLECIR